nr:translation initiation factor IF-2-like [Equus asinus]
MQERGHKCRSQASDSPAPPFVSDSPSGPGRPVLGDPPGLGPLSQPSLPPAGLSGVCVREAAAARGLLSIPDPDPPGPLSASLGATALGAPALARSLTRERRRRRRQRQQRACGTVSTERWAAGGERPSGLNTAEVAAAGCARRPRRGAGPAGEGRAPRLSFMQRGRGEGPGCPGSPRPPRSGFRRLIVCSAQARPSLAGPGSAWRAGVVLQTKIPLLSSGENQPISCNTEVTGEFKAISLHWMFPWTASPVQMVRRFRIYCKPHLVHEAFLEVTDLGEVYLDLMERAVHLPQILDFELELKPANSH